MLPILEVQNISKKYQIMNSARNRKEAYWALNDVNLILEQGQCFELQGDNGSGKSTLLKIISHIVYPTKGKVILRGNVASMLELGTGFHSELTGRENTFVFGSLMGIKRKDIKKQLDEIIDFAEVGDFIDNRVRTYSSGMSLRLAFSIASCLKPDLILIDELLSVADQAFREKCLQRIGKMIGEGTSVIIVEHGNISLNNLDPNIIRLDKGTLVK